MIKGTRTLGCFRLLDEDGSGSRRTVYKAVCEKEGFEGVPVGTIVALKVLAAQGVEKSWLAKLRLRVDGLEPLSHPGVARCFGGFCEPDMSGDVHILVTEWLEGETLRDRLLCNPQGLDADEILRIGEQVLSALAYVSSVGIVHRNIKPESIFLCKDGTVKLVDFELSQAGDRANGPEAGECDAFHYLAPEFLGSGFYGDEQSDIFSFGVCLHEMLTGRLPFPPSGCDLDWMVRWFRGDEDADLIEIGKSGTRVLPGVTDVLAKALRRRRETRFGSFVEFATAFKRLKCRELSHDGTTWRLLKLVGRGGFGEVFKACDVKTGQVVAIKRLFMNQYADRLRREARVLASLDDSSIVRFISFFEKRMGGSDQVFLVMEYLDGMPGSSLREVLNRARGTPLPRDVVVRAFVRYAHGLSVMHAKGVVHRDIKPANLYFPEKAIDRAAIMDLAIVRDVNDDDETIVGMTPCTPAYAPPEIVSGSRGDAGMDVYALGLSLYEALSGKTAYPRLPLGRDGVMAFLERARNKTRPNLDESSYSNLPDLVRLVREMTEPDVDKRLKDAAEVERRLRALLPLEADAPELQTLYAAPPYEELELGGNDEEACTIDDHSMYYWNSDEGKKALARQRRKQRFEQMCSYLLTGLAMSGAFVGLFWWGESCARDIIPELKSSLVVRIFALFPWLICLVWKEMKTRRLPNILNLGCLLTGLGVAVFTNGVSLLSAIGAAVAGAAALLPSFLIRSVGAGGVKMFAAVLPFWGVQMFPYAFGSAICMCLATGLMGAPLRSKIGFGAKGIAFSPIVLLSVLSIAVALWSWNGHGMLGGYVFIGSVLGLAAVARLLFSGRKQHAEVAPTPSSTCEGEIIPPYEDARTITLTGSEPYGLQDETCRESDDLVSETEDGTYVPFAFLNLHGHATVHGFRLDPSPLVAEGGQGRVFKAECVEEGRLGLRKGEVVALKFVEETPSSPSFEEFRKAVEYLREIKSPHVPRYYGCFEVERVVDGKAKRFRMTVMEYLDGADLGYRVKVRSPMFYADEIMYVIDQLLEGLCELAEAGIVHRDVKPSNVFICRDGTVKLIDFDTALIRGIDLCPKNRKVVGTPEFAAPDYLAEGFRGDEISDVCSAGMTLYYMVHGVSPHRARGTLDGRMDENIFRAFWGKHQEESGNQSWWKWDEKKRGDWLSGEARAYVPLLGIQQLFDRCLTIDRNRRFASFLEFRKTLQVVEFIRVRLNDKCMRVISDPQGTSSVGSGYSCIYLRDELGRVRELEFGLENLFFKCGNDRKDHDCLLIRYLSRRMYDLDASDPLAPYYPKDFIDPVKASCRSQSITDRIVNEKFSAEKIAVLCKSFADVRPLKEWQREVAHHEHRLQLS